MELLLGFLPILLSGAVMGAIISYLGPVIIKSLKEKFQHNKLKGLHEKYKGDPEHFAEKEPELKKFFDDKGYQSCDCPNCLWLSRKLKNK